MTKDLIISVFLFIAIGIFLYLVAGLLLPYATPLTWATILTVVFYPAYRVLLQFFPTWPSLAAGLMTLLVFSVVIVPTLLLSGIIAREAVEGYQQLQTFLTATEFSQLDRLTEHWTIKPIWEWVRAKQEAGDVNPTSLVLSGVGWLSEFAAQRAASIARNVVSFFISLVIMLFTLFFAFRDGVDIIGAIKESLPMAPADRERLFDRLQQTVIAVVQGMTVTAAAQGMLFGIGLRFASVPYAAVLSCAAFFLAFVPIGGAALVWVPTVLGVIAAGEWLRGLVLGIYCVFAVSTVDNFLRPAVIGSQAQLSTPILFFGILGGLQAYGVIGLFVGPAILSVFSVLMSIYTDRYNTGRPRVRRRRRKRRSDRDTDGSPPATVE